MNEFFDHLGDLGVQKVNTLVDRNDDKRMRFFSANQFNPSKTIINLEPKYAIEIASNICLDSLNCKNPGIIFIPGFSRIPPIFY